VLIRGDKKKKGFKLAKLFRSFNSNRKEEDSLLQMAVENAAPQVEEHAYEDDEEEGEADEDDQNQYDDPEDGATDERDYVCEEIEEEDLQKWHEKRMASVEYSVGNVLVQLGDEEGVVLVNGYAHYAIPSPHK